MANYNMRIANSAPMNKNGCYPFSEASINNIPDIDIFVNFGTLDINELIKEGCKEVLRRSMSSKNAYRYGEQGLLISTVDRDAKGNPLPHIHEYFQGEYHEIKTDDRYKKIVATRPIKDLIFIHNHPNNSSFS